MAAGFPNIFEQHSSAIESKKGSRRKHAKAVHRCNSCSKAAPEEPNAARSPVAMGVVVATSLYCGVKAGIQVRSCRMPDLTLEYAEHQLALNVDAPACTLEL